MKKNPHLQKIVLNYSNIRCFITFIMHGVLFFCSNHMLSYDCVIAFAIVTCIIIVRLESREVWLHVGV